MIRILDPTLGTASAAVPRAARPVALAGLRLGLLANGKSNGMALLERIAARLAERHGVAVVLREAKTNASAPAPEDIAERLASRCGAVVTAVGD